ncbi:hypothetical protein NXC12_CH03521 [Rhizobium etli]|uniref:DUF305 domain-containing protein n=1 Tax=Rhizobium etli TaxID=29449 RepID=A0AAN1EL92_RHIET|nr:DUF305 domain-containing protein [Rhizobium etli]ARQ11502.1 hypothetical protein NXC12_CH03521 [Rhizobium etli]
MRNHHNSRHEGMSSHPYSMFAVNMILSLIIMYFVMFSMIDGWSDFRNNLNMLYMALTMVAPMGIIMLATMGGMYGNRKLNAAIHVGLVIMFVAGFAGTRTQALIADRQFIASMVPHHSGAILMCREAALTDAELVALCANISRGQRAEIEQMNAIRTRLDQGAQ